MEVFVPVITMGVLGFLFSLGLVFAFRKLKVYEDCPRPIAEPADTQDVELLLRL